VKSIAFIEETIVKKVEEWTKDVVLFTGEKNLQGEKLTATPYVYRGFLPIRMTGQIDESLPKLFPSIIVQTAKGHHDFKAGQADVRIFIGCWDDADDHSGYQDVVNLVQILITGLYTERIIEDEFPMAGPVTWELKEACDLAPMFFGMLTVTLDIATPSPRFDALLTGAIDEL
jgi:hypothetical protein